MRQKMVGWLLLCALVSVAGITTSALAGPAAKEKDKSRMTIKLTVQQARRSGDGWSVKVEISFSNTGKTPFALDKLTICHDGTISNNVFDIRQGGKRIEYQGEMHKRAHPGPQGFVVVKPGASHRVVVEVGQAYRFPAAGGDFSIAFDSFNHFSKDAIQLRSQPATFSLKR